MRLVSRGGRGGRRRRPPRARSDRPSDSVSIRSSSPWNIDAVVLEGHPLAEQPEAVGRDARAPEEAGVGGADGEVGHRRAARVAPLRHPAERVPQRRVGRRCARSSCASARTRPGRPGRRGPRPASRRSSSLVSPGSVRMSTSSSTTSGMTLILVPPCDDRRRERRVGAGVELPGHARAGKLVEHPVDAVGRQQRIGDLVRVAHRRDEAPPHVVDVRLGLVLDEPAHDLGRGHQRVVGAVGLRAVARRCPGCAACTRARPSRPR